MANKYYNGPAGQISPFTRARAESVSDQFQAVAEGFDRVGDLVGPPGGNVMSIGLFSQASGIDVPAGTNLVQTSGYTSVGKGAARYAWLQGKGIEGQTSTRFTAEDGRVFGLMIEKAIDLSASSSSANTAVGLQQAFNAFDFGGRVSPERHAGWGIGAIRIPRGLFQNASTFSPVSPIGLKIEGSVRYASTISNIMTGGPAIYLTTAIGVVLSDFTLQQANSTVSFEKDENDDLVYDVEGSLVPIYPPTFGVQYHGENGGGYLSLNRLVIDAFGTCIRNSFDGNGDKALVSECQIVGAHGYDNTRNTQAIGWTFMNNGGQATKSYYKLGGVGMTAVINDVINLKGSYIEFPEYSGNPGEGWTGQTSIMATKLEQHGDANYPGFNELIDARKSKLITGLGGSNVAVSFTDLHVTGDTLVVPDPDNARIMTIGEEFDGNEGSEAIRVRALGGWIRGVIQYCTNFLGANNRRWSFKDMIRAPLPSKVELKGTGNHPLMEWSGNENVPVDQYRGGQGFTGSIAAEKAFIWRDTGRRLVDTSTGANQEGDVFAKYIVLPGFPPGVTITGCALLIDNDYGTATALAIYRDPFATFVGGDIFPGGSKGLKSAVRYDPSKWITVGADGNVYIRMTKPAANQFTDGAVVIFYFPYGGK